ncbi:MAG: hypothetical protein J7642_00505 [Cyanobacteria bacterium SBC]|nr:hypothetical protein [Cyanobacteria bacterium SBC]
MKVPNIADSTSLTPSNVHAEIPRCLGVLPSEIWNELGTLTGRLLTHRQMRSICGWEKGKISPALERESPRPWALALEGTAADDVSRAQSGYGILLEKDNGNAFGGFDRVVLDAGGNAVRNIRARLSD